MISKQKKIEPNQKLKIGEACLESWGRWAKDGDTQREIGREASPLRRRGAKHSGGGDDIGVAVDAAITALGDEYSKLALLVFKQGLTRQAAMVKLGWSVATFDKHLACLKAAAFVANHLTKSDKS